LKEIELPSGAKLIINLSPFAASKALWQAMLTEAKGIEVSAGSDMAALYKSLFCAGFSSPHVEATLWKCFEKCTYNDGRGDLKIDKDSFEPENNRQDYITVCVEVAKENTLPFVKSLYAGYRQFVQTIGNTQK
jgi:hypothetical protein